MTIKKIIISVLLLSAFTLNSQEHQEAQIQDSEPSSETSASLPGKPELLDIFSRDLDSAYSALKGIRSLNPVPLYSEASARIKVTRAVLQAKPRSAEAQGAFDICSVLTTAALLQMEKEHKNAKIQKIDQQKDSLLNELNNIHETIGGLERSYVSKIKDDMNAERLQSSKLKEDLEAERERARKMTEDAQRRFQELQSELIKVSKDARGTIISMSDILFDVGKASLTNDLKTSLARIAGILIVYKDPNIVVEGHTDNMGGEAFNQKLSEERAGNVLNFLIEQGVTEKRLSSLGYAFHKPIADNSTKEGRAKNRRVDLIIQD